MKIRTYSYFLQVGRVLMLRLVMAPIRMPEDSKADRDPIDQQVFIQLIHTEPPTRIHIIKMAELIKLRTQAAIRQLMALETISRQDRSLSLIKVRHGSIFF